MSEDSAYVAVSALTDVLRRRTQATIGLSTIMDVLVNVFEIRAFYRQDRNINGFNVLLLFLTFFQDRFTFTDGIIRHFMSIGMTKDLMRRKTSYVRLNFRGDRRIVCDQRFSSDLTRLLTIFNVDRAFIMNDL